MNKNKNTQAFDNFFQLVMNADFALVEEATVWYLEAQEVAEDVAELLNTTLEVGASVVSAFSPRERWSSNITKALAFANGKPVLGLTNNLRMAQAAVKDNKGFGALNGQKTNAFARAISGDLDAVVIDVWMIRAAGLDASKGVNKTQYKELSEAVVKVAKEFGLTPRTTQALIWLIRKDMK